MGRRKQEADIKGPWKILHDAEKIANIIERTPTEVRGDLLHSVAEVLRFKSQYYTADLIAGAAATYGRSGDA